jgi:hypothetical protein
VKRGSGKRLMGGSMVGRSITIDGKRLGAT